MTAGSTPSPSLTCPHALCQPDHLQPQPADDLQGAQFRSPRERREAAHVFLKWIGGSDPYFGVRSK